MKPERWPITTLGSSSFPPLLFLHGFLGRGDDWADLAARLQSRWHCLLPDLPGHGQHLPLHEDAAISFPALAEGLLESLQPFQLSKLTVIGYSLGGRLALHIALFYPESIKALILESCNPGLEGVGIRQARQAADDALAHQLRIEGMTPFIENWYSSPLFESLAARPALKERTISRNRSNTASAMARMISELSPGRMENLWPRLKEIQAPTLLIAGRLDAKYAAIQSRAHADIANSQLQILSDVGHNAHLEDPDAFLKVVTSFLESL